MADLGADGLLRLEVPYLPRPAFRPYHGRSQRWAVIVAHRRAGKTVATVNDLVRKVCECRLPNPRGWYISPTYAQSKRVAWSYLRDACSVIPFHKVNESELRVDMPNGGRVQLAGADNPDSLRGIYADALVLDEFAFMSAEVWLRILRPALADRDGKATFISSVNGRNEFHRIYRDAGLDPEGWFSMNLRADESGILPEVELRDLRRQMPEDDYRQEFLNDFDVATKGAYYGALIARAEEDGRVCSVPYDGKALVQTAWDLGYADATAIWFVQVVGREVHCIDFHEATGKPLSHYAEVIRAKPYAYGDHHLPHDAEAHELGSGKSRVEMLQELGIKASVAPRLPVDDGIAAVRALLPRVWFDAKRCADGLDRLRQYRAEYDERRQVLSSRPLHDFNSHAADAFRVFATGWKDKQPPLRRRVPLGWVA